MSNNKQTMKLYTEEHLKKAINRGYSSAMLEDYTIKEITDNFLNTLTPIELPSDEEIESRYNKFIDTEIQLGFLKQEQGERLKWYYKTYFIDKIQEGNND